MDSVIIHHIIYFFFEMIEGLPIVSRFHHILEWFFRIFSLQASLNVRLEFNWKIWLEREINWKQKPQYSIFHLLLFYQSKNPLHSPFKLLLITVIFYLIKNIFNLFNWKKMIELRSSSEVNWLYIVFPLKISIYQKNKKIQQTKVRRINWIYMKKLRGMILEIVKRNSDFFFGNVNIFYFILKIIYIAIITNRIHEFNL